MTILSPPVLSLRRDNAKPPATTVDNRANIPGVSTESYMYAAHLQEREEDPLIKKVSGL